MQFVMVPGQGQASPEQEPVLRCSCMEAVLLGRCSTPCKDWSRVVSVWHQRRFREVLSLWRHAWTDAGPDAADARPAEPSLDVLHLLQRESSSLRRPLWGGVQGGMPPQQMQGPHGNPQGAKVIRSLECLAGHVGPDGHPMAQPTPGPAFWPGQSGSGESPVSPGQCGQMALPDQGKGGCQGASSLECIPMMSDLLPGLGPLCLQVHLKTQGTAKEAGARATP